MEIRDGEYTIVHGVIKSIYRIMKIIIYVCVCVCVCLCLYIMVDSPNLGEIDCGRAFVNMYYD